MNVALAERLAEAALYPDLRRRSVLISGGATGIGEALVRAFAGQGARVAFVDLDREAGEALAEELCEDGAEILFQPVDITDSGRYQAAIRTAAERFGPITALLNNAANDQRHGIEQISPDRFDQIVSVNLKHAFVAAQAVAPMMRAAGGGAIVNFGSISWMMAGGGYPVYATCKAATHGLTRSLARDLGQDRIRVNTLVPGWVMTEKQLRLWVDDAAREQIARAQCLPGPLLPKHIAQMALFLASDASSMCSAQNFIVDGGWV